MHLSRRLRSFQRIDETRSIDSAYLTCAEYQLFLDSIQAQERYLQPSHWASPSFRSEEALRPICGITVKDAISFCDWLSQRQGGTSYYRLPEREEALSNPTAAHAIGAWCRDQRGYALIGLGESTRATVEAQLARLSTLPPPSTISPQPHLVGLSGSKLLNRLSTALGSAIDRARVIDICHSVRGAQPPLNANKLSQLIRRMISKEFVSDLLLARDLAVDLVLSCDGSLGAFAFFTDSDREILDRVRKRDVDRASVLAPDLHHIHEISKYKDLDLAFASDLLADLKADLDHVGEVFQDIEMALARQTESDVGLTLAVELVDLLALNVALCPIILAIDNHDQTTVKRLAQVLIPVLGQSEQTRVRGLIFPDASEEQTRLEMRRAFARTLERVYLGYEEISQDTFGLRWRRWLIFSREANDRKIRQQALLDYCWRLNIVSARQEGILPCWEGIRMTREEMDLVSKESD